MSKDTTITQTTTDSLIDAASRIVAAYVSNKEISLDDLPTIIGSVHKALQKISAVGSNVQLGQNPAVPISESVHDEYLICLEDGKKLSMLKRHLNTTYGLSLDQYKERWGLAPDYPTVSAAYARRRSEIAKTIGLGTTGRKGRKAKLQVAV